MRGAARDFHLANVGGPRGRREAEQDCSHREAHIGLPRGCFFGFYNARNPMADRVKNARSAMFLARLAELRSIGSFLEGFCADSQLERERCLRLNLVLEELFINTVNHGHRGDCDAPIWILLDAQPQAVHLTYEDTAPPFVLLTRELAAARDYAYLFGRNRIRLSLLR
ncbi:MAG: ATP-binding protein [Betaproteobacteria bacterium]|nr:MAG: ATP-binding protein [Betaproteobacteria bacterium]